MITINNYSNAQYYQSSFSNSSILGISVLINGEQAYVPANTENVDYQNILNLVEQGQLTIQPVG